MKTKVVAFRMRQDDYEILKAYSLNWFDKFSDYIEDCVYPHLVAARKEAETERKRLERAAKRDAKKAEANVIE